MDRYKKQSARSTGGAVMFFRSRPDADRAESNLPATFFGKQGEVYLGYDGSYRSNFSSNPSPSAYTNVAGYDLSNFRLGFRSDDGLNLFAWVRNAFDENYFEQLFVGPGNTGLIAGLPGDPRSWGATASIAF